MLRWTIVASLMLTACLQAVSEPTVGRLVSALWYVQSDSPYQFSALTFGVPEDEVGDTPWYVEVTNATDLASVKPMLTYGMATDEDVVLADPAVVTTQDLKAQLRQQIRPDWDENVDFYWWDETTQTVESAPTRDCFGTLDEYYEYWQPGLSCDEDYLGAIDDSPVSNRCWVAFLLKASGKKSPTKLTFSIGVDGSPVKPYSLGVQGAFHDENTTEWELDEWGGQRFGVYSTNYVKRALGVDVLWITNAYQIPIITRPYAGGQATGKAYVTFGGSESLEICFNAPMAGTYYIDGDFPYDYSYRQYNASLDWTTDTPGAAVCNMRPAIPSGATGSSSFTHLYQVQLHVDKAGPCVLKSPVANDVIYAAIPITPGKPSPSYPGRLSTDSNGNKWGSALVTIRFYPADTNSLFVATAALQYDSDRNLQSCGRVSMPKVWLQGEKAVAEAEPYDGYEFDHWVWSSTLEVPEGLDLTSRILRFEVAPDSFSEEIHHRVVALQATWKRPEHPVLPSAYVNKLLTGGKFDPSLTAQSLRSVMACNGKNTVEECYIAGIDPESETSELKAKIELVDGSPKISWEPALNGPGVKNGVRKYTVHGSNDLQSWTMLEDGTETYWNFFKVSVEMK